MESHMVSGIPDQMEPSLKAQVLGSIIYVTYFRACFGMLLPNLQRRLGSQTYDCHTALVKRRRERGENPNKQFCPVASSRKTPSQMTYRDHAILTSQVPVWEKNLAVDSCLEYFSDMSSL